MAEFVALIDLLSHDGAHRVGGAAPGAGFSRADHRRVTVYGAQDARQPRWRCLRRCKTNWPNNANAPAPCSSRRSTTIPPRARPCSSACTSPTPSPPPSPANTPPAAARPLPERLHTTDALWLAVVGQHHASSAQRVPLATQTAPARLARILGTIDRYAAMISPRKSRAGRSATDSVRAIVGQQVDQRDELSHALVRCIGLCPPGTFVKLDNGDTALVLRRSDKPNHPLVASLLERNGNPYSRPSLYQTASGKPRIQFALARSAVSLELDHRTMVRLGLYAAQACVDE